MKKIKIFLALMLMTVASVAFAQNIMVKGVVSDAQTSETIPYASVQLKGTTNGVVTDADGNYSISVPANGVLVVSSIGYKSVEVEVAGKAIQNVALSQDTETLDDVIVVAFGKSTKESFTGSAAVVGEDKLQKSQVSAVTNALAGAVAGVQLTSSNGAPGSTATIRIRGISSISAGNSPLIIVDGAPYSGDLNNINPNDIESMTVLKDAASNALYGARGANGVIMITTKSAKRGEAVVTFDGKIGVNTKALREYETISDPAGYYEAHYSALYNYYRSAQGYDATNANIAANQILGAEQSSGGLGYMVYNVPAGQRLIGANGKLNPAATLGVVTNYKGEDYLVTPDNWNDYAYKTGIRQDYNVSVAGADSRSNFYAAVGYLKNEGITYGSGMERLSARLRADYQAKKWLKVGGNMNYAHFNFDQLSNNGSSNSTGNVWAFTSNLAPIYPLYVRNADGSIKIDSNGFQIMDYGSGQNAGLSRSYLGDSNALMDNKLNTNQSEGNAMTASGYADFNLFKGLKFTVNATMNLDETRTTWVYNPYYGQFDSTGGTISIEHDRSINYNLQQLLNYNTRIGQNNIGIMMGHEYYNAYSYSLWGSKSKMFSQTNKELSGAVVDGQSAGSVKSQYNNEGYFARAQYDFAGKYYASASVRRDASSRFAPENRWGTFWSLGGAWIVDKEDWFNAPMVNNLKLKASIGSQGNDNIGSFRYTDLYDITNSAGSVATSFSTKGNRDITWETQTNFNAGAEFTLFNRVSGTAEFFNRKTTDMLFSFSVAPSAGYSSYYANVGDMRNRGFELDLNVNIINTKDIQWDVNANATWVRNQIMMLDDDKKTTTAYDADGNSYKGYQSGSIFVAEGVSYYTWYIKDYAGVDEDGQSMWWKTTYQKDANGEYVLDDEGNKIFEGREKTATYSSADYYVTKKNALANVYGGFGTSIRAYGFDFSINFSYQLGGNLYDSQYASFMASPSGSNVGYNYHVDVLKSWSADNKDSNIPRFQYGDSYSAATSTRFLTKGNYLNIENLNFGYTIPSKLTNKIKVNTLRVYLACENLGYFSARQGFDPRQGYSSSDASSYSPMRTVSGGVTLKF